MPRTRLEATLLTATRRSVTVRLTLTSTGVDSDGVGGVVDVLLDDDAAAVRVDVIDDRDATIVDVTARRSHARVGDDVDAVVDHARVALHAQAPTR